MPSVKSTDKFILVVLKSTTEIRILKHYEDNKLCSMQNCKAVRMLIEMFVSKLFKK